MTRFAPVFPVAPTPEDRVKREAFDRAQQEASGAGFFENFYNRAQESAPAFAVRQLYRNWVFPDDSNFKLDEPLFKQLSEGLPPDVWGRFTDARSTDQAYQIRNDLLQTQERRQALAASGVTGFAAAALADIVEPSNLALGLATGGMSQTATLARLSRTGKIAAESALGAAGFGTIEAYRATQDPFTTNADVLGAFAGGAGFGAASEALAGMGRLARGPLVGAASAIGPALAATAQDATSDQISDAFWLSFAQGAAFSMMHGRRNPVQDRLAIDSSEAARRVQTVREAEVLRTVPPESVTDAGRTTIAQADEIIEASAQRVRDTIDGPDVLKSVLKDEADINAIDAEIALDTKNQSPTFKALNYAKTVIESGDWGSVSHDDRVADLTGKFGLSKRKAEQVLTRAHRDVVIEPPKPQSIGIDGLADEVSAMPLPEVRTVVDDVVAPIKNNYADGVSADVIAKIEGEQPAMRHEYVSRATEERISFRSAKRGTPKPTEGLGSSGLNITSEVPVLTPDDVVSKNYSYAEFKGESVDLSTARALVDDLNKNVHGREYAVVSQSPGAYTVASRPTIALEGKLTEMIDAAKARRKNLAIPRGRTSGATVIFDEIVNYAYEMALRAVRAGVKTAGEAASFVRKAVQSGDARYHADIENIAKMAAAHWEDGKGTEEGVAKAIRSYDMARERSIQGAAESPNRMGKLRELFTRDRASAAQETNAAFSAEGKHLSLEDQATIELKQFERREKKKAGDFDATRIQDVPPPALAKYKEFNLFGKTFRASFGGITIGDIVGGSKVQTFRDLAARLAHDPIPRQGRDVFYDASTSKTKKVEARDALIERSMTEAYKAHRDYAESQGRKPLARDAFMEQAGIHRARGIASADPGIEKARTASSAFYDQTLGMSKRFGVPGAEDAGPNPTYMERVYNAPEIRKLADIAQPGEVARAFSEFAFAATPDMDPRVAALMGRAAAKRGMNADQHFADPFHDIARLPASEIADAIKADLEGALSPADYQLVKGHFEALAEKSTGPKNKKRIDMDYSHVVEVQLKDGNTKQITLPDLLVNNLEHNLHSNNHRSESQAHFIDVMRATFPTESVDTLPALERRLHQIAEEDGLIKGQSAQDIEFLMNMAKHVAGVPVYQNTVATRALRALRSVGTILNLSNPTSGLTQIPEATDAMSFAGSRAVSHLMPEIPTIIADVKAGKYSNADMQAMLDGGSAALSIWTDRLHKNLDFEAGGPATALEHGLKKATQLGMTYASGVRPVQAGLEAFAGHGVLYSFADRAFNPEKAFTDLDLRDMGLTRDEYAAINAQIVKHGDAESLSIGREKWDDDQAIAAFHRAFDLTTSRLVITRNANDLPNWAANTAWGQSLAQFRSFSMQSFRNKTMYGVHRFRNGDAAYANRLILSSAMNALVYAANVGIKGLGKPDAGEWYDQKLSPEEILKQSFARASYSSIIPMAMDTASSTLGYGDIFAGGRTTELRGGLLQGNPTYNYVSNLFAAPSSIVGPMLPGNDYRFSKQDARRLRDLFLPQFLGMRNAFEHLIEDLPATPQSEN